MHKEIAPAQAPVANEAPTATLRNVMEAAKERNDVCETMLPAAPANVSASMLEEALGAVNRIQEFSRTFDDAMVSSRAQRAKDKLAGKVSAHEMLNGQNDPQPAHTDKYVMDSWIGECEAAGVYSRKTPAFLYAEKPSVSVALTRSEVWNLAQRHLNTILMYKEYQAWNGDCDRLSVERAIAHELRFRQLCEQLSPEDQERFRQQIEIRQRYIRSVDAEVIRCGEEEQAFYNRVEAGLVSEAEIAAHVTPPFIRGSCVMPGPADGGPGPEEWELFSRYDENPFAESNEVANEEA